MSRPPKPTNVIKMEKVSHRTKNELKIREQGEKELTTGTMLRERPEVKKNKNAHTEFSRLDKLLTGIEKNDAIYEVIINRYCLMIAECADMEVKREKVYKQAQRLEKELSRLGTKATFIELRSAINDIACIYGTMIAIDKQVQSKRKMLLDIEKENIMTIAAALRSIPKKEDKKSNPLAEALKNG